MTLEKQWFCRLYNSHRKEFSMNANRPKILLLSFLSLVLCVLLWQSVVVSSADSTVYRFVALAGNEEQVDQAAEPFLADGHLKYVREYGAASASYQAEAPNDNGSLPNQFNIKLYQVMTTTPHINAVVAEVYSKVESYPEVQAEKDISYLAYVPNQLLLNGTCADVAAISKEVGLSPVHGVEPAEFITPTGCFSVGLFQSLPDKNVAESVTAVNLFIDNSQIGDAYAQPNQFTMGFPSGDYIFGSPAGMATPGSTTLTLPKSPFAGQTGQEIAVVLFDTSPYVNAPAISTQVVNGVDITVDQSLPLPANLPFSGQSVVGSHGTVVATPVTHYAPNSDIYLMRTLSLDGIGTEFMLIRAIVQMRDHLLASADKYQGVIFNYSLGVEEEVYVDPLSALARTLDLVHETNIFQVAAAGNNSAWRFVPQDANLPASHPNVFAVTATAPGNKLACYANKGDIATWGGGDPRSAPGPCLPNKIVSDCAAGLRGGCLTGVDPHSPNGWAYAVGTSFASPIIAGMAAQRMELMGPPRSELWIRPTAARTEMELVATPDETEMGSGYIGDFEIPTSVGLSNVQQVRDRQLDILTIFVGILTLYLVFSPKVEKIRQ